jgi:hypothetical protein
MPIAIVLRKKPHVNAFRDLIVGVLGSGAADTALLCSGFFQENFKGSAYQASAEKGLASACAKSGVKLTTVGIHNGTWKASYLNFEANMIAGGARVNCLYKNRLAWHAKVFVASNRDAPVFGIVGSSNITRNAFSVGGQFNNECDVILWPDSSVLGALVDNLFSDDFGSIIRAPYLPEENGQLSIEERLTGLREEVMSQDLRALSG